VTLDPFRCLPHVELGRGRCRKTLGSCACRVGGNGTEVGSSLLTAEARSPGPALVFGRVLFCTDQGTGSYLGYRSHSTASRTLCPQVGRQQNPNTVSQESDLLQANRTLVTFSQASTEDLIGVLVLHRLWCLPPSSSWG
jgi:hypothetical protein